MHTAEIKEKGHTGRDKHCPYIVCVCVYRGHSGIQRSSTSRNIQMGIRRVAGMA